jgi:AAA domain
MLRLRHLRLRASTQTSVYGCDIPFTAGLNVIQAGNTSGKSTCLQAIVYALGLERSLGPQLDVPLPYAMRERIHRHRDEPYEPVLGSYVELEMENANGEILTIRRDVIGGKDQRLIQAWNAPRLSDPNVTGRRRDFFVHDPGAAQRDDGFHAYFARFLGWELPQVTRFDGTETTLYLEAIFPMMFVEQKRGWSAIQGPFPTFLRIQDIARRVMEFMLDLEAGKIRRERTELRREIGALQQRWADLLSLLEELGGRAIRVRGIPQSPTAEFAHIQDVRPT